MELSDLVAAFLVQHFSHKAPETSSSLSFEIIESDTETLAVARMEYMTSLIEESSVALQHLLVRRAYVTTWTLPPAPS